MAAGDKCDIFIGMNEIHMYGVIDPEHPTPHLIKQNISLFRLIGKE
jgi:hypothetical protein